jgi:hypothetical protein
MWGYLQKNASVRKALLAAAAVLAGSGLARAGDLNFSELEFQAGGIGFISPR